VFFRPAVISTRRVFNVPKEKSISSIIGGFRESPFFYFYSMVITDGSRLCNNDNNERKNGKVYAPARKKRQCELKFYEIIDSDAP